MRWTDEQTRAILAEDDVLLEASAGTGKTTTIVGRVLWLLGLDVGVRASDGRPLPPCPRPCGLEQIAAITFTEKAAFDLKGALREAIIGSERGEALRWEIERASVGTIHAFCAELLRDHALRLGVDPTFRILDERETRLRQDETVRDVVMEALERGDPGATELVKRYKVDGFGRRGGAVDLVRDVLRDLRWRSRRYEGWTREPAEPGGQRELDVEGLRAVAAGAGIWDPDRAALDERALADAAALYRLAFESVRRWLGWMEEENVRDFDTLILDARRLLATEETALAGVRARYRILIIDEFQDTDRAQRDIAFAIAGLDPRGASAEHPRAGGPGGEETGAGPRLFLVGDPKQSIYRFRGADISVWNEVRARLCGDRGPLRLSHNFRSAPRLVEFVNRVCGPAMAERATALAAEETRTPPPGGAPSGAGSAVEYQPLVPAREPTPAAGVEWLAVDGGARTEDRRLEQGRWIGARIRSLVGRARVWNPRERRLRACTYRDIAVLARQNRSLEALEPGLREMDVPFYNAATGGLADRQEILDLVTVLRLIDNPRDDLRAFAYLRSPFVGLRDEVLARIRLDPASRRTHLLRQAANFLEAVRRGRAEWFVAPESARVAEVEQEALEAGLGAIRDAHGLVDRADTRELLEGVLERTGYPLHLLLRPHPAEALANVERFQALLDEYRHLSLGSFLALWSRWGEKDLGIPQAPLFSRDDRVVTLSTIHGAKGLEWPIVFLADATQGPTWGSRASESFWTDPRYGPVFLPKKEERGPRAERLLERMALEEAAEEARLLYVALTRARDRLVVCAPVEEKARKGYAEWLGVELAGAVEGETAAAWLRLDEELDEEEGGEARAPESPGAEPSAGEPDPGGQMRLPGLDAPSRTAGAAAAPSPRRDDSAVAGRIAPSERPLIVLRNPPQVQAPIARVPISLTWLEGIEAGEWPELVREIPRPARSFLTSATELMMRERNPEEWALRYLHAVQPAWVFAPEGRGLPATVRGVVIHGVLEKIHAAEELARVLDETIAGIDEPDLENLLAEGTRYREELEREIDRVVRSGEWQWYVEPPAWREYRFLRLLGRRSWLQGAFDLLRPAREGKERDRVTWVVDFKTHRIEAGEAARTAREYAIQAAVYREAAAMLVAMRPPAEPTVRVRFHFTHPNVGVELDDALTGSGSRDRP